VGLGALSKQAKTAGSPTRAAAQARRGPVERGSWPQTAACKAARAEAAWFDVAPGKAFYIFWPVSLAVGDSG